MFARSVSDQAMWDAIMAEPENDAPRLVYADALQQRGEPLGEFIAVQCHPDFARTPALIARSRQLYEANVARWTAEVGISDVNLSFDRGLPHLVRVPFTREALAIVERVPVRWVRVHALYGPAPDEAIAITRVIAGDARLARVSTISTWGDDACAQLLIESPHFVASRLIVEPGGCTDRFASALAGMSLPRLEKLSFGGNRSTLGDAGIAAISSSALKLRVLGLSHLPVTGRALEALAETKLPLEGLGITFAGDVNAGLHHFAASATFARLSTLTLACGQVDDRAFAALVGRTDAALTDLDVSLNKLSSASIDALRVGGLPKLDTLNLGDMEFDPQSLAAFAAAPRFGALRDLNVRRACKGPELAVAIASSPHAKGLRQLDLSHCLGRDEAAFALASSESLRELERLNFFRNKPTHAGRKALHDRFGDKLLIED
ncbi:MAG: TIGR02996 domain-containing protein [Archangium sp.]